MPDAAPPCPGAAPLVLESGAVPVCVAAALVLGAGPRALAALDCFAELASLSFACAAVPARPKADMTARLIALCNIRPPMLVDQ